MSDIIYSRQTSNVTAGTSLQGYIKATYCELTKAFGQPETFEQDDNDGKIKHLWVVNAEGVIFTIYDYKADLNTGLREEWHIGSKQYAAVRLAEQILESEA